MSQRAIYLSISHALGIGVLLALCSLCVGCAWKYDHGGDSGAKVEGRSVSPCNSVEPCEVKP